MAAAPPQGDDARTLGREPGGAVKTTYWFALLGAELAAAGEVEAHELCANIAHWFTLKKKALTLKLLRKVVTHDALNSAFAHACLNSDEWEPMRALLADYLALEYVTPDAAPSGRPEMQPEEQPTLLTVLEEKQKRGGSRPSRFTEKKMATLGQVLLGRGQLSEQHVVREDFQHLKLPLRLRPDHKTMITDRVVECTLAKYGMVNVDDAYEDAVGEQLENIFGAMPPDKKDMKARQFLQDAGVPAEEIPRPQWKNAVHYKFRKVRKSKYEVRALVQLPHITWRRLHSICTSLAQGRILTVPPTVDETVKKWIEDGELLSVIVSDEAVPPMAGRSSVVADSHTGALEEGEMDETPESRGTLAVRAAGLGVETTSSGLNRLSSAGAAVAACKRSRMLHIPGGADLHAFLGRPPLRSVPAHTEIHEVSGGNSFASSVSHKREATGEAGDENGGAAARKGGAKRGRSATSGVPRAKKPAKKQGNGTAPTGQATAGRKRKAGATANGVAKVAKPPGAVAKPPGAVDALPERAEPAEHQSPPLASSKPPRVSQRAVVYAESDQDDGDSDTEAVITPGAQASDESESDEQQKKTTKKTGAQPVQKAATDNIASSKDAKVPSPIVVLVRATCVRVHASPCRFACLERALLPLRLVFSAPVSAVIMHAPRLPHASHRVCAGTRCRAPP